MDNPKEEIFSKRIQDKIYTLFSTMAYPVRIRILNLLSTGKYTVMEIAEQMDMTQSAISHQLKLLRETNLVKFVKVGNKKYYELADKHIYEIYRLAVEHVKEETNYE